MQAALEAGAEDVVPNADTSVEVLADPFEFATVRAMATRASYLHFGIKPPERAATLPLFEGER